MNIQQLLSDYSIPIAGQGNKHWRQGWINCRCPFCGEGNSESYHLGFPDEGNISTCWKCGVHPLVETISKLLNVDAFAARKLILDYKGTVTHRTTEKVLKIRSKAHRHPSNTGDLLPAHRNYLIRRKFDPDLLIREWQIQGTGPISTLDKIDYSRRIFIPILWEGKEVTFQTRDITNKHPMKYLACPEDRELIKHKHIIYKHPDWNEKVCICCEGVTDVWRFGRCATATFGIKYTPYQVRAIAKLFTRVAVCFDGGENAARMQADKLIADLRFRKVDAFRVDIVGDPGGLPQTEADYIVKQIIK
jgi:hypothetical protein